MSIKKNSGRSAFNRCRSVFSEHVIAAGPETGEECHPGLKHALIGRRLRPRTQRESH
jgi:hypothetical protein